MLKPVLIAASLAAVAGSAHAGAIDYSLYDVSRAQGLAETLVLCDRARLLQNPPDPSATRTYVRDDPWSFELVMPPDFTRSSGWYDFDVERAYQTLRARGRVTRAEVNLAQAKFRTPELSRLTAPNVREERFLRGQARACTPILREIARG